MKARRVQADEIWLFTYAKAAVRPCGPDGGYAWTATVKQPPHQQCQAGWPTLWHSGQQDGRNAASGVGSYENTTPFD